MAEHGMGAKEMIGIYQHIDFDSYSAVQALNGSSLINMRRSAMYYRHCEDYRQPETVAQKIGTAAHLLALEPERKSDLAMWGSLPDEKVRRGRAWDEFCKEHRGKLVVTVNEYAAISGMSIAVHKSTIARKYLDAPGRTEVCMFWRDKVSGRRMKGRPDKIISRGHTIVDLKTTRDCRPYKFGSQAYSLGYHIKAYMYCSGYEAITGHKAHFKWIAIESKPPYECAVYSATPDVLLQGAEELEVLLTKLAECESSNTWPPALEEESDLTMPAYAFNQAPDSELFLEM